MYSSIRNVQPTYDEAVESASEDPAEYEPTSYLTARARQRGEARASSPQPRKKEKMKERSCCNIKWILIFLVVLSILLSAGCVAMVVRNYLQLSKLKKEAQTAFTLMRKTGGKTEINWPQLQQFLHHQSNQTLHSLADLRKEMYGAFGILGWYRASNRHWYKLVKEMWSFDRAKKYCQNIGTALASTNDTKIVSELKGAFQRTTLAKTWVAPECGSTGIGSCCALQEKNWTRIKLPCYSHHNFLCEATI